MRIQRLAWTELLRENVPAFAVMALVLAAFAGAGQADAATFLGGSNAAGAGHTAATGIISTAAGGVGGPGPATKVGLLAARAVAFAGGYLYIADSGVAWSGAVRKVSMGTDLLTTPAGNGTALPLGNGGPAANAGMDPEGVAVDATGNMLIADTHNNRVREVAETTGTFYGKKMTAGDVYTVAGNGKYGFSGDGGPATSAELGYPAAVALDAAGNLLIADNNNGRVRVVAATTGTFYGQAMTTGHIYTVAGGGGGGDGGPATSAELQAPNGVTVDAAGNLLIADTLDNQVRVVAATTGTFYGQAMTAGDIYTVAGDGTGGFSGDGGPSDSAELNEPFGVGVDASGNLLIADYSNLRVRVVAATTGTFYGQAMTAGDIYTVAGDGKIGFSGDGGPATSAKVGPQDVTVDSAGNLLIADRDNLRVRVVAATTGTFYGQAMTAGDIYTVAGNGKYGYSGDGGPATSAELNDPGDVAVDAAGNRVIADTGNSRVRVVAAATATFYGKKMTAGDIYTVAGDGTSGFSGDGGPAASARLNSPSAVAVDATGNLVIADTSNYRVRVVAAATGTFYGKKMTAGDIYTVAGGGTSGLGDGGPATSAELNNPSGVAVDANGNLLIADLGTNRVRVVAAATGTFYGKKMTAGDIYTVAGNGKIGFSGDGGAATSARLYSPSGVAVDAAGNLLIADLGNYRVRVVAATTGTFYGQAMTAGDIYTVAGNGTSGFSGDGGPATSAELGYPTAVSVDAAGNLLIADSGNNRVRAVAATTGTFYGQAMTAGDIYTVAGDGKGGFSGDGGPATSAELSFPGAVAVDAGGDLVIADSGNGRVRVVGG